jgi:hypothetical protein
MRATCKAAFCAGIVASIVGTSAARAQPPATAPAPRTTLTTGRAATPAAGSYWGSQPTAPARSRPSAWQRFKSRFTWAGSSGQNEGTPVSRDPTTGRTNLTLAKPWMAQDH